jgi:hypothetical protein
MIAKAILFKRTESLVRPMFQQAQANVAAYVVSLTANRLGESLGLNKVWLRQDISPELKMRIQKWAAEVNRVLHDSAGGRMISEWAKRPECWREVCDASYAPLDIAIPEAR